MKKIVIEGYVARGIGIKNLFEWKNSQLVLSPIHLILQRWKLFKYAAQKVRITIEVVE
jgi:hypothetical protein